jgi:hypothetical protein
VENLLAARLARQEILDRDEPPLIYLVLDEAVLHRKVGAAEVMREQLSHLAEAAQRVERDDTGHPVRQRPAHRPPV